MTVNSMQNMGFFDLSETLEGLVCLGVVYVLTELRTQNAPYQRSFFGSGQTEGSEEAFRSRE